MLSITNIFNFFVSDHLNDTAYKALRFYKAYLCILNFFFAILKFPTHDLPCLKLRYIPITRLFEKLNSSRPSFKFSLQKTTRQIQEALCLISCFGNTKVCYQISYRAPKNIATELQKYHRYYHTSFQGNLINFYFQSKKLQIL